MISLIQNLGLIIGSLTPAAAPFQVWSIAPNALLRTYWRNVQHLCTVFHFFLRSSKSLALKWVTVVLKAQVNMISVLCRWTGSSSESAGGEGSRETWFIRQSKYSLHCCNWWYVPLPYYSRWGPSFDSCHYLEPVIWSTQNSSPTISPHFLSCACWEQSTIWIFNVLFLKFVQSIHH